MGEKICKWLGIPFHFAIMCLNIRRFLCIVCTASSLGFSGECLSTIFTTIYLCFVSREKRAAILRLLCWPKKREANIEEKYWFFFRMERHTNTLAYNAATEGHTRSEYTPTTIRCDKVEGTRGGGSEVDIRGDDKRRAEQQRQIDRTKSFGCVRDCGLIWYSNDSCTHKQQQHQQACTSRVSNVLIHPYQMSCYQHHHHSWKVWCILMCMRVI